MNNYQIKIVSIGLMNTYSFEIVSKWDDGDFNDGHWVFDTLADAKDAIIAYMHEQHPQIVNDPVGGVGQIRAKRLCDLWDVFWSYYDEDMKRLDYLLETTDMSLEEIDNKIKERIVAKAENNQTGRR